MSNRERTCAERVREHWASRKSDLDRFMNATDEATQQEFDEYALCFDYLPPGTYRDQKRGYWRYQISWGGPSDEIRMWGDRDLTLYRAEYWYLDWYDGASINVTNSKCVQWLWDEFRDMDSLEWTRSKALRNLED